MKKCTHDDCLRDGPRPECLNEDAMTPEDAKNLMEDFSRIQEDCKDPNVQWRLDFKKVEEFVEAARIVERERCAEIVRTYECYDCVQTLPDLEQLIISPNQDIL